MKDKLSVVVIKNFVWRLAERCGAQVVSFVVSIILARLLVPSDYGTVALVNVFMAILQVFVDSGLGTALIQKKNADDLDFSSVFFFNIFMCLLLYCVCFFSAPAIAAFYNDISLIPIVRVLSVIILVSGVKGVQQAYVAKNMLFKKFFFSTIGGTIFSGILGITMAYAGKGVWAIVAQQISNLVIDTLILWITVGWRPIKAFSLYRLKKLFSFGWKLLCASFLETGYNNLRSLIIGKKYNSASLAYYNQGEKFPTLIVTNINTSIDSILLPTMSKVQDDVEQIKNMTRRAIRMSTFIIAPAMIGLACCADTFIQVILTEKWMLSVSFVRIFCIAYMLWPIHTANLNAINALGRSDYFLKLELIKKTIGILILIISMGYGTTAIAVGFLVISIIGLFVNIWPNKKLLNYGCVEQIKDVLPIVALSVLMGASVYLVGIFLPCSVIKLFLQIIDGCLVYIMLSYVFRIEEFQYILNLIKSMFSNKVKSS